MSSIKREYLKSLFSKNTFVYSERHVWTRGNFHGLTTDSKDLQLFKS